MQEGFTTEHQKGNKQTDIKSKNIIIVIVRIVIIILVLATIIVLDHSKNSENTTSNSNHNSVSNSYWRCMPDLGALGCQRRSDSISLSELLVMPFLMPSSRVNDRGGEWANERPFGGW